MSTGLKSDTITKINHVFSKHPQISSVILYGSRAMGTHRIGSDVDFTVKGKGLNLKLINKIHNDLDDLLLPYKFDLSIFDQIDNADLIKHIERVGIVLFKAD